MDGAVRGQHRCRGVAGTSRPYVVPHGGRTGQPRHAPGQPARREGWTTGNHVRPLIHGAAYFRELLEVVCRLGAGDLLLFTDWRGDPDERLDGPGTRGRRRCSPRRPPRGAEVRGLVWRSHLDRLPVQRAREPAPRRRDRGGRRRVPARHARAAAWAPTTRSWSCSATRADPHATSPSSAASTCATAVATTARTAATRRRSRWPHVYGRHPPWHDVQLAHPGPAVGDAGDRLPRAVGRPGTAEPQPRAPPRRAAAAARTDARGRCRRSCRTRTRPASTRSRCCAPTRAPTAATRSPGRGAQHRARLPEGAGAGPGPGLPRGPVPVVVGGGARCSRRRWRGPRRCTWSS